MNRPRAEHLVLLAAVVLSALLNSCRVAYVPSMENVPLLQRQGELVANMTPANFQGAYSPVEHLGLMINGQVSGNKWNEDGDIHYEAKRQFVEGGLGYYRKQEDDKIVELYGGAGFGTLSFRDDLTYDEQEYSASMVRTFIQPAIGYSNDYVDVAFSARFLQLKFMDKKVRNYSESELRDLDLFHLDKNPYYFIEPAVTVRAGYKFIKAQFQYLYSLKLNQEPINRYNQYLFLGLSFRF